MKSVLMAYLQWFFAGSWAVHRFYLGRPVSGYIMITTYGGLGLWLLLDLFLIPGMVRKANLEMGFRTASGDETEDEEPSTEGARS